MGGHVSTQHVSTMQGTATENLNVTELGLQWWGQAAIYMFRCINTIDTDMISGSNWLIYKQIGFWAHRHLSCLFRVEILKKKKTTNQLFPLCINPSNKRYYISPALFPEPLDCRSRITQGTFSSGLQAILALFGTLRGCFDKDQILLKPDLAVVRGKVQSGQSKPVYCCGIAGLPEVSSSSFRAELCIFIS